MSIFPTVIDTFTTHVNGDVIDPAFDNAQQVAISALEAKVGVDSSAVTTSHDYKLSEVTSTDKAVGKTATQTLANKTLTSPKITVGSDAVGDLHYLSNSNGTLTRIPIGTDNQILKLNGTTPNWEAETVTVAATEAVEGISRLATASQINTGTASEASYPLVVTPDQLALSTPIFDGSGLTNLPTTKVSTSPTAVNTHSTTGEQTLATVSLPANTLGTSNAVRISIPIISLDCFNTGTVTFRLKYGGTTVSTITFAGGGTTWAGLSGKLEGVLMANASTSAQIASLNLFGSTNSTIGTSNVTVQSLATGTATEVSTGALTLIVTAQNDASGGSTGVTIHHSIIEKIK